MRRETFKERERRRREEEILTEAGRLIREHGMTALNMDTLAELVGISKPTLYQHFKSKEELTARILIGGIEQLEHYLLTTTQNSPMERLTNVLRMLLENRYKSNGLLAGVSHELILTTVHTHEGVLKSKARVRTILDEVVEEGKRRGEIEASLPTPMVSCMVFNLMGLPAAAEMQDDIDAAVPYVVKIFTRAVQRNP
ncbi:MAG: TetR/AcrR family transcriptional regulator [Anaerolineae bacterium]